MPEESWISDDPGTILDSHVTAVRALQGSMASARPPAAPLGEVAYRSAFRWTAPRVLICNDGSLEEGETVHVRSDRIVIGRTKGEIVIGHDVAMSASHAELVRRDVGGQHTWLLCDLESSNGMLAKVKSVTLRPGMSLLLGSKRYRFELPSANRGGENAGEDPGTSLYEDLAGLPEEARPALVESGPRGSVTASRHTFRATEVTIGRPGLRIPNAIEIDDVCLAAVHAVVKRDVSGVWRLEAQPSLNGVWVRVNVIKLVDHCPFQCGEQRFRFQF